MTFRLTCLLIFTILLASPANVFAESSTTVDPSGGSGAGKPPVTLRTDECPSGVSPGSENCKDTCTGADEICFRDVMKDNKQKQMCCGKLSEFCKVTGLHSYHSHGTGAYLYKWRTELNKTTEWYKREAPKTTPDGVSCPIPNSFTLRNQNTSYPPVGWEKILEEAKKETTNLRQRPCSKNTDCETGEFCDAVWNPTFNGLDRSGPNNSSLRFCYKQPELPSNMKHADHDIGLKICNQHIQCGKLDEICHHDKVNYKNESNPAQDAAGLCVHVDACDGFAQKRGVLNVKSQECRDDNGCEGAGLSKGNADYNPLCKSYFNPDLSRKLCCYQKLPVCRVGKAVTPPKNCTKMSDCTGDVLLKDAHWNTWCDDGDTKICCKDLANKAWQCPDLATPLFNEPACTGWTADNIHSGKCPKKGGRCVYGHCCPPLSLTKNGTDVKLGKNLYHTEFPCDPKNPIPSGFSYVFCNSDTKKLVVVGKFHDNGDKMTKVSGSKCTINADCSSDGGSVCVYENDKNHVCYYNPLRALRPEVSSFWKTVLIISLVCGAIFMILSIVCFVCYRSKSVFDRYKKKKGSKDSKSSKTSKKGGKGGKKGGKGGKKGGKKSGSSSSKSKKSKTSKKETEKSEGGTTGDSSSQMN